MQGQTSPTVKPDQGSEHCCAWQPGGCRNTGTGGEDPTSWVRDGAQLSFEGLSWLRDSRIMIQLLFNAFVQFSQ